MPRGRKKKSETPDLTLTTKQKAKKVIDDTVEVTEEDIAIVQEELDKNLPDLGIGEFGEKKRETNKKKHYESIPNGWDCDRIVLNVDGKKYTKTYPTKIFISQEKIGKLAKYAPNKWAKVKGYEEGETDLILILIPVNE